MSTLDEVKRAIATGTRSLGAIVYWTNLADAQVSRPVFRQGFDGAGLGDAVVGDPHAEAVLNRACQIAARRQPRDGNQVRTVLKRKDQDAVYAVLMRRDDATVSAPGNASRVRWVEEALVSVDRYAPGAQVRTETLPTVAADDRRDGFVADVVEAYDRVANYVLGMEISDAMVKSMDVVGGVSMRIGVYFVPFANLDRVLAMRRFVEGMTKIQVTTWDVKATDDNAETARHSSKVTFLKQLTELVEDVKSFTDTVTPEDANTKAVNSKVARFHALDSRVELWADILGDYARDLRASIEAARIRLLDAYINHDTKNAA